MLKSIDFFLLDILLREGYRIVVIFNSDSSLEFWCASKFTPNTLGSDPVDFCEIIGTNVTNFFKTNTTATKKNELVANFDKVIENGVMLTYQFSKNIQWQFFTI